MPQGAWAAPGQDSEGIPQDPENRPPLRPQRAGRISTYCAHSPRRTSRFTGLLLSTLASVASKLLSPVISTLASCRITSPSRRPARAAASTAAVTRTPPLMPRSEEHTSELQSQSNLVCRLLLEKKKYTLRRESSQSYRSFAPAS